MEKMINKPDRIRNMGIVCIAAAVIWTIAISIEYPLHLQPPGNGAMFTLDQAMFLIAQIGFLTGIAGLMQSHSAGYGWFGKISLGLFGVGLSMIMLATILGLFTHNYDSTLFPLGGPSASLGCLLSGIAIVAAKHWQSWQRWSVLIYAIYYWTALFLPLLLADQEPTQITEAIWGLAWLLVGLALFTNKKSPNSLTA